MSVEKDSRRVTLNYKIAKSVFTYKPDGTLVWKVKAAKWIKPGDIVGSLIKGYVCTKYKYTRYSVHRIIWLLHHKKFPNGSIDHINGIRSDNRIQNLRDCTHRENLSNTKKHREGKRVGYTKYGNRYCAQIKINGRKIYLGSFKTEKEAVDKYQDALRKHNSLCYNSK